MRRMVRAVILLCLLAGSWQLGASGYIQAKARLAQELLDNAWQETLDGHSQVVPWPWADTFPVGRMKVARLDQDLILLDGDSGRTLAFGPGVRRLGREFADSWLVSGHRDTHFEFLQELRIGDRFEIQRSDGAWTPYVVRESGILDVRNQELALPVGVEGMALATCFPFDAVDPGGPLRFVIWAEMVGDSPARVLPPEPPRYTRQLI